MRSLPACRGRWSWGHTAGSAAMASMRLGPQILGVRAGVADPPDPVDAGHRLATGRRTAAGLGAGRRPPRPRPVTSAMLPPVCAGAQAGGQIPAVGVDVLAQQGDTSTVPAPARPSTSATIWPKGRLISGPRTAGTMQKAQLLSQPIWMVTQAAQAWSRRTGRAEGKASSPSETACQDLQDGPAGRRRRCQQLAGPTHVVGAPDRVHPGGPLLDQLPVLLGQAAADGDLQAGPATLERLEVTELAVQLVVGVLPDAAGVEHHHVGVVETRRPAPGRRSRGCRPAVRSRARSSGSR